MRAPDNWLVFDCEAVAISDVSEYLEPVSAPSNYKDPEKIAAYITEGTRKAIESAALDVDFARIVAIGWQTETMSEPGVMLIANELQERVALNEFWNDVVSRAVVVGFNIRRYDLPLQMRRSQLLGLPYPEVNMDRYRSNQMIDLLDKLTFNGAIDGKKLTTYCRRFGIKADDDATGADIAGFVQRAEWDAVKRHVVADVLRTRDLALAIGAIVPASVQEAVEVI
jgi:3'-5' exonuclease